MINFFLSIIYLIFYNESVVVIYLHFCFVIRVKYFEKINHCYEITEKAKDAHESD